MLSLGERTAAQAAGDGYLVWELSSVNNVSALTASDMPVAIYAPWTVETGIAAGRIGSQPLMPAARVDSMLARLSRLPFIALPVPEGTVDKSVVASLQSVEAMALALEKTGRGDFLSTCKSGDHSG